MKSLIGSWMRRVLARLSAPIAPIAPSSRPRSVCASGCSWPWILLPIQVAKPSLSQMSSHQRIVTRSPNHWCASSCALTPQKHWRWLHRRSSRRGTSGCRGRRSGPAFSIAPAQKSGAATLSSLSNGYGDAEVVLERAARSPACSPASTACGRPAPCAATPRSLIGVVRAAVRRDVRALRHVPRTDGEGDQIARQRLGAVEGDLLPAAGQLFGLRLGGVGDGDIVLRHDQA